MIIGTLPVVIPLFANVLCSQRDGRLSWRRLAPALALIGFGLLCVNIAELSQGLSDVSGWRYGSGIVLALISVACWAWYALRNARWLRENPDKHPMMWATAQALVTLPVSLIGYAAVCLWLSIQKPLFTPALWPASRAVYRSDDRHRGAVFLGGRAVLEYRQPKIANRYFRAADCF
ncbi:membrane protein [Salmonella enterica subsp. enterica serovar Daytona]|uniref:Membrane protein n=1 Tax=Salmonella enterica subsp. enterica serovar Daytona TaxID=1962639 RepID=A0A447JPJ4_SALET|nr:membrane protein [Salmonella enterica subsp. enterica serovar Daytona]